MANFHYMVKCPKAHSKLKHYSPSGRNASLIKVVLSCARKEENVERPHREEEVVPNSRCTTRKSTPTTLFFLADGTTISFSASVSDWIPLRLGICKLTSSVK
jgi:hypothetical protein